MTCRLSIVLYSYCKANTFYDDDDFVTVVKPTAPSTTADECR